MNDPAEFSRAVGRSHIDQRPRARLHQHVAIFLADGRVLSDETFRLVRIEGQEQINQAFELKLELHANTQDRGEAPLITFDLLLSRPVTACIDLPAPRMNAETASLRFARALKGGPETSLSLWNGIVSEFSMAVPGIYHLTLRPALWALGLTNRYRVYRQMSIRGLIESVLRDHGITVEAGDPSLRNSVNLSAISGADNPAVTRVQDWLQAGESDLELLQRVAARAHVYFYFEHHATCHCIVYANRPAFADALPEGRQLRYTQTAADALGLEQDDIVFDYRYTQAMTATGVDGFLVRQGAAWEQDPIAQFDTYHARAPMQLGALPFRRLQVVQYGGSDAEVRWDTLTCDRARNTSAVTLTASSTCALLRPGGCFTLDHAGAERVHPRAIRPSLAGERMVVFKITHQADLDGVYRNQFEATAAEGQLGGFAITDTQQGTVLAQVVMHDNGENPQDWRYYQRNAFDPELDKLKDSTANPVMLQAKGVYVHLATDAPETPPTWVKLAPHMVSVPELGVTVLVARAADSSELPEIQNIVEANGRLTVKPSGWTASTTVGSSYSTVYGDGCSVHFGQNSLGDLATARNWVEDKYGNGNSSIPGWFSAAPLHDVSWSEGSSSNYTQAEHGRDGVLSESISVGSTYSLQDGKETRSRSTVDYSYSDSVIGSSQSSTATGTSSSIQITGASVSSEVAGSATNTQLTGLSSSIQETAVSVSMQATGSSNTVSAVADSSSLSYIGSALDLSSTGARVAVSSIGALLEVTEYGGGVRSDIAEAVLTSKLTGLESTIVSLLKVIL